MNVPRLAEILSFSCERFRLAGKALSISCECSRLGEARLSLAVNVLVS